MPLLLLVWSPESVARKMPKGVFDADRIFRPPPTIPRDPVAGQNQVGDQIRFDAEPHEPGDGFE